MRLCVAGQDTETDVMLWAGRDGTGLDAILILIMQIKEEW